MLGSKPWGKHLFAGQEKYLEATGSTKDKEIMIYTDGSQEIDKAGITTGTEVGWVMHWVGSWHGKRGISIGITHEVYDAEAAALLGGLKEVLNSAISQVVPGIHICLDNLSVAQNAGQVANGFSQNVTIKRPSQGLDSDG